METKSTFENKDDSSIKNNNIKNTEIKNHQNTKIFNKKHTIINYSLRNRLTSVTA